MKLKMIYVLSVGIALVLIVGGVACSHSSEASAPVSGQTAAYYTCPMHPSVKSEKPGACPICGMTLQPVFGNTAVTNTPAPATTTNAAADVKPYPLDTCLVDGMKLGSMGAPYVFTYQGQAIKFCCANCKPDFLKDPDKYLQKLQAATAAKN